MRTTEQIQKVLDQIKDRVNEGDPDAEIMWDSLRWVTGEEEEDPHTRYFAEDD